MCTDKTGSDWNKETIFFIIINVFLFLFGFGWLVIGAVVLDSILLNSDVNTILNTITVLSGGLGDNIEILSIMLILVGVLITVDAVIAVIGSVLLKEKKEWKIFLIIYSVFVAVLFVSMIVVFGLWIHIGTKIKEDGAKVQMVSNLYIDFTEDAISSSETKSNSWNRVFMDLDCCAVYPVFSTSNDFDLTPWCTTSGECQQTNSQIPKTCCNGVTESTYTSAPSACHATVKSGTYNSKGCHEVLKNEIDRYLPAVIAIGVLLFLTEV
ncbi:CD82 antigen-like [Saccostrea echinata]|uniref:CD82 antigen-like n=1 Tax=Saccostrea echinata TaxID=191078 RepID=UPI002A803BAB|nr:CD82 antigen-like [Saccostrea echinata]